MAVPLIVPWVCNVVVLNVTGYRPVNFTGDLPMCAIAMYFWFCNDSLSWDVSAPGSPLDQMYILKYDIPKGVSGFTADCSFAVWHSHAFYYRTQVTKWSDKRVTLMSEIIKGMRVIKMYCWERPFSDIIETLRRSDISSRHWSGNSKGKNILLHCLTQPH